MSNGALVVYARKSSESEEKQMLSIPAQLAELRAYAARSNLRISMELEESCSAREPGRPVFSKLLTDVAAGRVSGILCWRLDRLARNPIDGGALTHYLGKGLLNSIVTPEGTYTGSGDSKFMLSVLFGAATKMTDDLSAGVKRGNRALWERGRISGVPPLGYVKDRTGMGLRGAAKVIPDPARFQLVEQMWREFLRGGKTVSDVWQSARVKGLTSRTTRAFPGALVRQNTAYQIFRNPFYAGHIVHDGKVYQGDHTPMVTPAEFRKVQTMIRPVDAPRLSAHSFAYTGLLRCGHCGGRLLVGETHTNRQGHVYVYYRCGRRRLGYAQCFAPAPREEQVTADLMTALDRVTLDPNLQQWSLDWANNWATREKTAAAELRDAHREELVRTQRALERLTDLTIAGGVAEAEFFKRRETLSLRVAELQGLIGNPDAVTQTWLETVKDLVTVGAATRAAFDVGTPEERRSLIDRLYVNLTVTDRKTALTLRHPYSALAGERPDTLPSWNSDVNLPSVTRIAPSKRKSARLRDGRERALATWCTRLEEVRTSTVRQSTAGLAANETHYPYMSRF